MGVHRNFPKGATRVVTIGAQFPWWGITAGGAEKSQQCRKYFLQYASQRPQVRTWENQTCFLPRALSYLVTSLRATSKFCLSFSGCWRCNV